MNYTLPQEITVLTNQTINVLLKENPDSLTLYLFYIHNSTIQKTNAVWILDTFACRGLKWGKDRVSKAKNILVKHNLIETKQDKKPDGTFGKKYVKINYIWTQETKETLITRHLNREHQKPLADETADGFQDANALSNKNINALSNKKGNAYREVNSLILETIKSQAGLTELPGTKAKQLQQSNLIRMKFENALGENSSPEEIVSAVATTCRRMKEDEYLAKRFGELKLFYHKIPLYSPLFKSKKEVYL